MYYYETTSHVPEFSVWVTSPSIRVTPIWRVALGPWRRPMASRTTSTSMLLMTIQMETRWRGQTARSRVCMLWMSSHLGQCVHCVTTGQPCDLQGTECEDKDSRAVCRIRVAGTCSQFTLWQAAWNSGPFFSKVHGSPWAAAVYCHLGGWSTA